METPSSSARRVTRSQAMAASTNKNGSLSIFENVEKNEKGSSESVRKTGKKIDGSELIDITNDSPVVGLAIGSLKIPSLAYTKKRSISSSSTGTPGSGEALLRGQVKTFLQKVEDEAELSKFSVKNIDRTFLLFNDLVNCQTGLLLAPTPNSTSSLFFNLMGNIGSFENFNDFGLENSSPSQEEFSISKTFAETIDRQINMETEKSSVTRSLLFDFSEIS